MKENKKTFWYLFIAYVFSMTYQYYRYTLNQHPADTFGEKEIIGYSVLMGWSAIALIDKKWAVKAIIALCALQLAIGLLYYFPFIFRYRHDSFWDWAEAVAFMYLISIAGFRSVLQLTRGQKKYSYS